MKSKIFISVFLVSICIFYSFKEIVYINKTNIVSVSATTSFQQDSFLIGAMYDSRDKNYNYLRDTLGFNIWHKYTAPNNWGWPILYSNNTLPDDQLNNPVSSYSSDIRERMALNNTQNLKTLIDRPKFQYLAFGQRSDYQSEKIDKVDPDYWFYTYYNSVDNGSSIKDIRDSSKGAGEFVKQCLYNHSTPGANAQMLFDSLKGNMEQINNFWQAKWVGDGEYEWYVMPRIRIDSAFGNNPSNQDIEVCKIIIRNRDGDSLTQILKVKHFKKDSIGSIYNGNYLEIFNNYITDPLTNLVIPVSNWFNSHNEISFGDTQCKVDFKVFWYDKCDMWIDRIRVENQPAHLMMTLNTQYIEEWIRAEVEDIAMAEVNNGNTSPYKFYIEEFEMSHLPCIAYLNKKIISYSHGRFSLMVNYNHDLFKAFIPRSWDKLFSARQMTKYLIDSSDIKEIFTECYGFEGWRNNEHGGGRESYVPNTLYNGPDYQHDEGILVYKASPQNYDTWLQEHFDEYEIFGNGYTHIFQHSDSISKLANIPFLNLAQAHMWSSPGHMLKEPTNEEIALMNNLAVSYGARGILYFSYDSNNDDYDTTGGVIYSRGLTNSDDTPRRINVYGQNKWQGIINYNKVLKKWGPYLMSFNNVDRKSFIYRNPTERNLMSANTFINKLEAFPAREFAPDPIPDFTNSVAETNNAAYLQAAIFKKENETEQSQYFMIVNRRCSPFIDYTSPDKIGGRRLVTMKVNPSYLQGFTNWKIYNLETGDTSLTFSKYDTAHFVFIGDFLPGEGKLYKLSPIMQEGGTLVADESVSGVEFICKGEVLNNGKNITIGNGTNISFHTGAGIKMTYGNFICDGSLGSENINLKGYNGQSWNGINLTNTLSSTKIEKTTIENTRSPLVIYNSQFSAQYAQKIIRRNIFKVSQDSGTALRINNQFALSIDSNTFDVSNYNSTSGIYFSNYTDPGAAGAVPEDYYNVNITNNTFSGAYFPVMINDLGTAYSSFYMYNNQFINTGLFGITGMKITGTIKNNRFVNPAGNYNIYLSLSNPDIYGNSFNSDKRNMILKSSYPNVAPIRNSNNQLIWKGGRNGFYVNQTSDTTGKENIYYRSSLPLTDFGENDFSVPNSSLYHIFGSNSEQTSRTYLTRRNCWAGNNDIPKIFIYNPNDTPVTQFGFIYTPTNCIPSDNISNEVTNIGFDINDTTFLSANGSVDTISQDEALYSEAVEMLSNENFTEAGTNFKSLIDEFPSSEFTYSAEYYLYDSYCGLDTSSDQSVTDVLFGDLKQYLQAKISSGNYDDDFEDNAFYLILMCDNKMDNYNSALTGYEFISLYHPDADRRIQASWEYDNIENIMNGMGGGERDLEIGSPREAGISNLENDMNRRFERINEFADNDPATAKIRQNYMKANDEKKISKEQRKNKTENIQNINKTKKRSFENDEKLFERAKQNLYLSKRSSKKEKERRRFEDLKLILNPDNVELESKETDELIPIQYFLSQNYPNPFNPVTKISFELPNDANVKLVVYDLLGREVKSIVNSQLTIGKYTFEFDGSNFATGVYFYKLVAGDFTAVKRMVLIK